MCAYYISNEVFISKLTGIVQDYIHEEEFGVNELASKIGLSHSQLHRKLKSITGKSASQFIREVRLKFARDLILEQEISISEIAYQVGFNSASYFNKCYHEYYGYPPGDTIKNTLEESGEADRDSIEKRNSDNEKSILFRSSRVRSWIILASVFAILVAVVLYSYYKPFDPHVVLNTERSLAILPCKNFTGNVDNEYLIDGFHDMLIGKLSEINDLRVISHTSSHIFRDSSLFLPDIASELGVNTILESSIMQMGDSIRLVVQLIDVFPREKHLMAYEYHESLQNILNLQSVIAKDVARNIHVQLGEANEKRFDETRKVDPEMYRTYLRGMYYINQGTYESFDKGIKYLQDAIDKDPANPDAYSALALGFATMGHGMYSSEESFRIAMHAAQTAIRLDSGNDRAYTAMALLNLYDAWEWEAAREAFENALKQNPNNEIAHAHFAWYYVLKNNKEKAEYHATQAALLNPLYPSYSGWLSVMCYYFKDYAMAGEWADRSIKVNENAPYALSTLALLCIDNKEYDKAIAYVNRLPDESYFNVYRMYTLVQAGKRDEAFKIYNHLLDESRKGQVNTCYLGVMAAVLDLKDEAMEYLNMALEQKSYPIEYVNIFPFSDDIKDDSRYLALLKKINPPEE